jgi:hypothetical protein
MGVCNYLHIFCQNSEKTKKGTKARGRPKKNPESSGVDSESESERLKQQQAEAEAEQNEREQNRRDDEQDLFDEEEEVARQEKEAGQAFKRKNREEGPGDPFPTPSHVSQAPAPPKKKARGRAPGATHYTDGDFIALLDAVEEILPTQASEWPFVEEHYNQYAIRFHRKERKVTGLKSKFRDFSWGEPSGGGERNEFQTRAKKIEKMINEKGGVMIIDDASPKKSSSSSSGEGREDKSTRQVRSSRLGFEKMISTHLESEARLSADRHQEKMALLTKFLDKF